MDISNLKLPGQRPASDFNHIIGIQGEPNTGKTTAAVSWPNPLLLDFDKKCPPGVQTIPFWDASWIHQYMNTKAPLFANRKQALIKWLRDAGPNLPTDMTLVVDSYTAIEHGYQEYVNQNRMLFMTKPDNQGNQEYNQRAMFMDKFNYNIELFALLKSTPCPVVLTFHEQIARNEKGQPTGKFRTVVSGGQFKDVLEGCVGMMIRTLNEKGRYLLQVRSNDVFDAMIAPGYKIPLDVKHLDITDTTAFQALQKYKA